MVIQEKNVKHAPRKHSALRDARRQIATALLFKGIAQHRTGNSDLAYETLESILDMEFGPDDRWQAIPDFKLHALRWLIELADRQGASERTNWYQSLYDARLKEFAL